MIGTVAELKTYAAERGFADVATAADAAVLAALVRASDYITFEYVSRFRTGYDASSPNVEPATYEAAILEFRTANYFNTSFTPDQRTVLVGVGNEIRWEVVEGGGSGGDAVPISTRIEAMLRAYMNPSIPAMYVV